MTTSSSSSSTTLEVQSYNSSYYESVFKLVYETSTEGWVSSYLNTWHPSHSTSLLTRFTLWALITQTPMPWPVTLIIGYELLVMAVIYGLIFWMPTWSLVTGNMVDYGLKEFNGGTNRMWIAVVQSDRKKVMGGVAIKMESESRASLSLLFVHPEMRGIHMGQQLWEHALDYLTKNNVDLVVVRNVANSNTEALGLLKKNGFKVVRDAPVVHKLPCLHWLHQVRMYDLQLEV